MLTRRTFIHSALALAPWGLQAASQRDFAITQVGDLPITPESPTTLFTMQDDFVHGRLLAQYKPNAIQLLRQRTGGAWVVAPGVANQHPIGGTSIGWTMPFRIADPAQPETLLAVLVKEPLPQGLVLPPSRWGQIVLQSEPVHVSCASFARSQLRLTAVGSRVPIPGVPVPVANFEEVRIAAQYVPLGALVQLVVQPTDNSRRWPSSHIEVTHDLQLISTAYFGRMGLGQLDLHTRFWLYGIVTSYPLPVRERDGIDATEWLKLTRYIKTTSPKVDTVRAILPDAFRVQITRVGVSNDGTYWLTNPIERVEGTFAAGPRYIPTTREIITLLVRASSEKNWHVAGAEYLTKNRAYWMLPAADLQPAGANSNAEFIAIAVVSFHPFDQTRPVTESDLRTRQVSISDEVRYRLAQVRR
jgi:hypothetical protein